MKARNPDLHIIGDTVANLIGATLPMLVTLFTVPAYLRATGSARYGAMTLVWLIVGYFSFFDLGTGRATTNRLAKLRDAPVSHRTRVFWTAVLANIGLGTLGGIVLWAAARAWGARLFGLPAGLESELLLAAPWLGLAVPLVTTSGVLTGALEARQEFRASNTLTVLGATLTAVLPLGAAILIGPELRVLVVATVLGRAVAAISGFWVCRRAGVYQGILLAGADEITGLLRYGGWVSVSSVVSPALESLDRFLISTRLGAATVPYYAIPLSIMIRAQVLASSLQRALFPRFSARPGDSARLVATDAILALAAILTPLFVIVALLLRPFLRLWIGSEYALRAGPAGELLVLGVWANSLAFIPYALLQGGGRPDVPAKLHVAELTPYVMLLWASLSRLGLPGAALAWSVRVVSDAVLLFIAGGVARGLAKDLSVPGFLVALAVALALTLPDGIAPRAGAALVSGALALGWSWHVAHVRFREALAGVLQTLTGRAGSRASS